MRNNLTKPTTSDSTWALAPRRLLRFRLRTLLVVAAFLPLLIAIVVGKLWSPLKYYRWEELRESNYHWLEVVAEPAGDGPYLHVGAAAAGRGDPVLGAFTGNGTSTSFHVPGNPDEEYRVVGLVPKDGSPPTYAILRLRHAVKNEGDHKKGQDAQAAR